MSVIRTARSALSATPLILTILAAACSSGGGEAVATSHQSIINGTPVPNSSTSGYVLVTSPGFYCSGILLAPDWALTAAHCDLDIANPGSNTVTMGSAGGPQEVAHGVFAVTHASLDYALIQLDHKLDMPADNRGIFTLGPSALKGLTLTAFGYSNGQCGPDGSTGPNDTCAHYCESPDECAGFGVLRSGNFVASGIYDEFNFNLTNNSPGNPQFTVPGDSGGPLMLLAPSGPVLTGVLKSGPFGNTPNFRDWVLSYMFSRPVNLPEVWFLGSQHPYLQAHPLQDNFANTTTWDVCPGMPYSWSASYALDPADAITVSSSLGSTGFPLAGNTVGGSGQGPLTIAITTGTQATRAAGLKQLQVACSRYDARYAPPLSATSDTWNPCPNTPYFASMTYAVPAGATLTVNGQALTGSGTTTFPTATAPMALAWGPSTDGAAYIGSLQADCTNTPGNESFGPLPQLRCLGPECVTGSSSNSYVPAGVTMAPTTWSPCGKGAFEWTLDGAVTNGATLAVTGADGTSELFGNGGLGGGTGSFQTYGPFSSAGALSLAFSGGGGGGNVFINGLSAVCLDWHTVPASGIHVVAGTYGANCGANPGNKTYDLANLCDGQSTCNYGVSYQVIGDPFPGCAKDYSASWTCDGSTTVYTSALAPEAGYGSVANLTCPSGPTAPSPACLAQCRTQFEDCVDNQPPSIAFCRSQDASCQARCACQRTTCAAQGARCGSISDGCGGTLSCGSCTSGLTCTSANQCVCIPATCQSAGAACGSVPDGCGGTLSCGTCSAGEACSGNQCVCAPHTCGYACGTISDGCGGTLSCKPCTCTPSCTGKRCGAGNGCGGQCSSGSCAKAGYVCSDEGDGPICVRAP